MNTSLIGQIVRSHGRRFVVVAGGREYDCTSRGKRVDFVCGDRVHILLQNKQQAVIEQLEPRQSLLYRQDDWRSKMIAANVSRILFVTAAVPSPNETLLNRCLIAAEAADIDPVILVNKTDLPQTAAYLASLAPYIALGYPVIALSAKGDISQLNPCLAGQTSVMVGQSGMGKSTLTNALIPEARARTGDISTALDSGRHTTTHATLYQLDADSQLIDSPGLQEFGLKQLSAKQLVDCFPEMRPFIGQCRFHNCSHRAEPGCAIKQAAEQGLIRPFRLALLQRLTDEVSQ